MGKAAVIIQGIFFLILLSTYYYANKNNQTALLTKWLLFICAIGVLSFDEIKLFLFIISVGAVWIISLYKKSKRNGFT